MLVDVWLRDNYVNCMPESHFVLQLSVGLSALFLTDIDIVVWFLFLMFGGVSKSSNLYVLETRGGFGKINQEGSSSLDLVH